MIIRHDRPDAACLVDEHDWLGIVTFFDGDGAGTVVAPEWILTAAHTARNIPTDHSITVAGHRYRIARVIPHPDSRDGPAFFTSVDLALVELDTPIRAVRPFGLYEDADEQGREVLLLGRGDYGNGMDGVQGVDHRLRRATNQIDAVDDYWISFRFDLPPDCTPLEGVSGEGDSGGPALIWHDEQWLLAGVSSWQEHKPKPLGTYGCTEHYARVSRYTGWIRALIDEHH